PRGDPAARRPKRDRDRRADDAGRSRLRAPGAAGRRARLRAQGSRPRPAAPPDDLTEREVEVLRLIALGHTNTEIAAQLFLSTRTVETHRAHVQQKLRRTTRAELVRYALE